MKKKKIIFLSLLLLVISLIIYSGFKTIVYALDNKKIQEEITTVNKILDEEKPNLIEVYRKEYQNNDIVGILKIDDVIKTLLVQTDNNYYYLGHLVNKKYNKTGSIFIDYRTNIDTSKQVNIFGHSSGSYDIPFNNLKKYLKKSFYEEHKTLTIQTDTNTYNYEIFSVKITNDEEHLNIEYQNTSEFKNHIQKLKEDSLYETGINVTENDDILTLQTCIFNNPKGSLLIINLRKVG